MAVVIRYDAETRSWGRVREAQRFMVEKGRLFKWPSGLGILALLVLAWNCSLTPLSASPKRDAKGVVQQRVTHALRIEDDRIVLDGELSEPEWAQIEPAKDFVQRLPETGAPATESTEVRLLYDSTTLYVGVYLFDSAGNAGIVINDISEDFYTLDSDGFQIVLDTFDDDRNSFLFGTNPGAGRFDMQIGGDGDAGNTDWDGIWEVRTKITEQGWQLEMAIPFKTLRFPGNGPMKWGVNFERRVRRKYEDSHWCLVPPPYRLGRVSLGGVLEGLENVHHSLDLRIKPYVTAPVLRRENDDVDFQPDAGVDVKYGVSSQLTLDLTVNPDFAQVEADEEQINLGRFSLFFPEKREFFLENAGIFSWGRRHGQFWRPDVMPFFSRRIGLTEDGDVVPILGGVRLSGRAGAYSLGLLNMQAHETSVAPEANFSVIRVRRDVLRKSDVGGIFVDKQEFGGRSNQTYGADANFNFFRHLDINTWALKTQTTGEVGEDAAANVEVGWRDQLFNLWASFVEVQENVNPEVGFVSRSGMRKASTDMGITPRPGESIPWIREFNPSIEVDYITDTNSTLETRRIEGRFSVTFSDSSELSVVRETAFERLTESLELPEDSFVPPGDYWFENTSVHFRTNESRMFSLGGEYSTGTFFDGQRDGFEANLKFQPTYRFVTRFAWSRNDVDLPDQELNDGGLLVKRAFETDLVGTRIDYAFTPNMFLNAFIQYNSDAGEVISNIRYRFIYKPLSDFYIVYNERRDSTGEILDRALIAKLTYMFSF